MYHGFFSESKTAILLEQTRTTRVDEPFPSRIRSIRTGTGIHMATVAGTSYSLATSPHIA